MLLLWCALICAYTCTTLAFVDESVNNINSKNVTKRYDLDLQTCIENFDVHLDKIIRTQDSRAMGANYINEFDVGSREECLRLCCETDTCDVFVFEEKSPGSCYLFHCGSPDDFKCKFTKHHNYTSAVLTVSKHMTELESQIKLTKHEEELTRLRKPAAVLVEPTSALFPPTTNLPSREVLPLLAATTNTLGSRRCSRYQFECRSSGECIAIYNACDGIPQCSDASDEGPELDCPAQVAVTSAAPQPAPAGPPVQPTIPASIVAAQGSVYQQPAPMSAVKQANMMYQGPRSWQQQEPAQPPRPPPYDTSVEGQRSNGNTAEQQHYHQPVQRLPAGVQGNLLYGREGEGYMQWPAYQQYHKEYDDAATGNSHIFNHKSSGLMSETDRYSPGYVRNNNLQMLAQGPAGLYGEGLRSSYYVGSSADGASAYRQPVPNSWQQQSNMHDDIRGSKLSPDYYYEDSQDGTRYRAHRPSVPEPGGKVQDQSLSVAPRPEMQRKGSIAVQVVTTTTTAATSATPITTTAIDNTEQVNPHRHHQQSHSHDDDVIVELVQEDDSWGQPVGAVLSLALGLCITCIMVVLVACRLRMVRRRLRRGGKSPYAHDADYLVNGMYL